MIPARALLLLLLLLLLLKFLGRRKDCGLVDCVEGRRSWHAVRIASSGRAGRCLFLLAVLLDAYEAITVLISFKLQSFLFCPLISLC